MTAGKRVALLLAIALMAASPGWADVIDPTIIVRDGGIKGTIVLVPGQLVIPIVYPTDSRCEQTMLQDPSAPPGTLVPSMSCFISNESHAALQSLTFAVSPAQPFFTLSNTAFGSWVNNPDFTLVTFTFATPLLHFSEFTIDFVGFNQQNPPSITLTLTPVPEPGAMGLMLAGLGAVGLLRWRRRSV